MNNCNIIRHSSELYKFYISTSDLIRIFLNFIFRHDSIHTIFLITLSTQSIFLNPHIDYATPYQIIPLLTVTNVEENEEE